jgi:phenylpropionate dioxygenase-like ring-hydroxylating dioxygenase large terminal subunit
MVAGTRSAAADVGASAGLVPEAAQISAALHRGWFPVARSSELEHPVSACLLDVPLVVFRDEGGTARVMSSQCPHRGADLSMGTVVGSALQCPYHGWRWAAESGRCVAIPALAPDSPIPPAARVRTYEAHEKYGLVWTSLSDEPFGDLPHFEEFDGPEWEGDFVCAPPWDVPGNICMAIEGFRDLAHFPFVHEATMGPTPHEVPPMDARREGLHAYLDWTQPPREVGSDSVFERARTAGGGEVRYHSIAPSAVATLIEAEGLPPRLLLFAVAPTTLEQSRWYLLDRLSAGYPIPVEQILKLGIAITDEDVVLFERIQPRGFEALRGQVHCVADAYTLKYRQAFMAFVQQAAPVQ